MKIITLFISLLFLFSCTKKNNEVYQSVSNDKVIGTVTDILTVKKLMETHCYLCHSPNAAENQGRIAPPMVAIKARYIEIEGYNRDEFIENVVAFVANPTEDKALMFGAIRKHGLMPKQAFPEGTVAKIAAFMFDYQIEEPEWFKAHWQANGNKSWKQSGKKYEEIENEKTYADVGLEYALETKKVLGKNLMEAIQQKGTLEALVFCNSQALSLTDSMSINYNASIKRVSDKNRNPHNSANAEELNYIAQFKKALAANQEIKPVAIEKGNKIQFYYPIETNSMCLQCHGKHIKPEISKQILKFYPKDLAVGYDENEVRGIWSITFDKK
ncbi:c-type heme family protein [Flavobacterium sp. UBA6135]|uniref:c-type heme family protein n=1 Tax=Flavobacterium sp. UBA6135 TaxID=1946553 RepID=UPI0025BC730F|nr:DUF3365 domain-containing protein [Flavobacterium sp. UBA6135]